MNHGFWLLVLFCRACEFAGEINKDLNRRGWVATTRIIEAQGRKRGGPVFQNLHHLPRIDVGPDILFHKDPEANILEDAHASHACLIEDDRTSDIVLRWLALGFEMPAVHCSVRKAYADTYMRE